MNPENPISQPPLEYEEIKENQDGREAPDMTQVVYEPESVLTDEPHTSKSPKKSLWPIIALIMLAIAGLVGWRIYQGLTSSNSGEATETANTQARLPVRVVQARTDVAQGWVFDEGTSLPVQIRILNFYASGDITYVARNNGVELKEGDFVSRGELLATIDARRQNASIETADADIQVAVNQRDQSEAALLQAQANLEKAESDLALAKTEFRRFQALFEEGAVSASDRDAYRNRVDQAEAAFKTAQQTIRSAEDGVQSAESSITAAQARRNRTTVDLEDTQLVSPIDGVIAYINIQEGEYWNTQYLNVSSPQGVIETAPIVVGDPSAYEVELEIQADDANAIRPGQRAYVVLEEDVSAAAANGVDRQDLLTIAQQRGTQGRVFAVSPSQTPDSRGTKILIRDFEQVRNLKVNARVYVWIETVANQGAVVLPLGAVLVRGQEAFVFVVNEADRTVTQRQVVQGVEGLSEVEILSGLQPGELVVIEGQNRLVDGSPIEIVNREQVQ
ncbi:MAG: HlyD family efflux transporter periplasmic adaptor subunit [Cyanobacteria bacterium P01_H01_bin.58]